MNTYNLFTSIAVLTLISSGVSITTNAQTSTQIQKNRTGISAPTNVAQAGVIDGPQPNILNTCKFNAAPQQFEITVTNLEEPNGAGKTSVQVFKNAYIYTYSLQNYGYPNIEFGSYYDVGGQNIAHNLGNQISSQGALENGGFAHDDNGYVIIGNVYHVRGKGSSPIFLGPGAQKKLDGAMGTTLGTIQCTQSMYSAAITLLNNYTGSNVPQINGASRAYNTTAGSNIDVDYEPPNWEAALYKAYRAEHGEPGWVFEETNTVGSGSGSGVGIKDFNIVTAVNARAVNLRPTIVIASCPKNTTKQSDGSCLANRNFSFSQLMTTPIKVRIK